MPIIVTKCIGATKMKTKDLATQICLMYVEIEKQDVVVEELLKGTEHKNPKISAACVAVIAQALRYDEQIRSNHKTLRCKLYSD